MASIDTSINRPNVPADGTTVTAEIDVEPGAQEQDVRRHIALCIDTSGSMEGDNIKRARDGAAWVFGLLADDDYVSIVAFDTEAEVILPATRWSDLDRQTAMDHVEELTAGGGTDMYNGLEAAKQTLSSSATGPDTVKRLLLLSDGKDNERTPDEFEDLAEEIESLSDLVEQIGEAREEVTDLASTMPELRGALQDAASDEDAEEGEAESESDAEDDEE